MPVPTVSLVDLVAELGKEVTEADVNNAMKKAADGKLKGILQYCDEELVSVDFKGNPHSSIFDAKSTKVMEKRMIKVFSWYDNEWGFSCRMKDLVKMMAERGL